MYPKYFVVSEKIIFELLKKIIQRCSSYDNVLLIDKWSQYKTTYRVHWNVTLVIWCLDHYVYKKNTYTYLSYLFIFTENKAEKEKKREENKKKKEVGLQKNAEFLQSLDIFKQQVKLVK